MSGFLQQLVVALVAGFILWLSSKIYYQRRLYYVVQNLFDHSNLSDGGTVEIVVANLGRRGEEHVQLELVSGLRYELVAATSPDIRIDDSRVIRIPRLAPRQQLALLILAEGNQRFEASHIAGLSSKDVVGKSAKDMSEANASDPVVGAIALALIGTFVAAGAGAGYFFGKEQAMLELSQRSEGKAIPKDQKAKDAKPVEQLFQLGCPIFESNGNKSLTEGTLKELAAASVQVTRVYRQEDVVRAELQLENVTGVDTEYAVQLKSPASDSTTDISLRNASYIYDIVLMEKGTTRNVSVSNYLPEKFEPQVFWIESRLEIAGYWVSYRQKISLGAGGTIKCPGTAG